MKKKIFLLRHGKTDFNGLYIGSSDVALGEDGTKQVILTRKILQQKNIQRVFCSPMKRCRDTFSPLQLGVTCTYSDNLREINFGRWEKRSFQEIKAIDKKIIENWVKEGEEFCFPEGEQISIFNDRIKKISQEIIQTSEEEVLIVAHGGSIRQLLCIFLQIPSEKKMIFGIDPGSFCTVELYGNIGRLTGLNERG